MDVYTVGYPCCSHCEHFEDDYHPALWSHEEPCPHGCDDPED